MEVVVQVFFKHAWEMVTRFATMFAIRIIVNHT